MEETKKRPGLRKPPPRLEKKAPPRLEKKESLQLSETGSSRNLLPLGGPPGGGKPGLCGQSESYPLRSR